MLTSVFTYDLFIIYLFSHLFSDHGSARSSLSWLTWKMGPPKILWLQYARYMYYVRQTVRKFNNDLWRLLWRELISSAYFTGYLRLCKALLCIMFSLVAQRNKILFLYLSHTQQSCPSEATVDPLWLADKLCSKGIIDRQTKDEILSTNASTNEKAIKLWNRISIAVKYQADPKKTLLQVCEVRKERVPLDSQADSMTLQLTPRSQGTRTVKVYCEYSCKPYHNCIWHFNYRVAQNTYYVYMHWAIHMHEIFNQVCNKLAQPQISSSHTGINAWM